jgi:phospholipid transport system substrate-binding protein
MITRTVLILLTASFFVFAAPVTAAPEGPGTKTVREVNTKLSKTLATKVKSKEHEAELLAQARKQLGSFLDIDELGRRAMKDHWEKLTAKQQADFQTLLRNLIETNYVKGLRANVKYDVEYVGEKRQGEFLLVQTVVRSERRGRPLKIEIDYLLRKSGKDWRTFDMTTDGIGLVENYRAMFNKLISKSGVDGLLERMRSKLAAMNS